MHNGLTYKCYEPPIDFKPIQKRLDVHLSCSRVVKLPCIYVIKDVQKVFLGAYKVLSIGMGIINS